MARINGCEAAELATLFPGICGAACLDFTDSSTRRARSSDTKNTKEESLVFVSFVMKQSGGSKSNDHRLARTSPER
jgi:hypothetical protein